MIFPYILPGCSARRNARSGISFLFSFYTSAKFLLFHSEFPPATRGHFDPVLWLGCTISSSIFFFVSITRSLNLVSTHGFGAYSLIELSWNFLQTTIFLFSGFLVCCLKPLCCSVLLDMLLPSYSSLQQAPYTSQPSFQTLISRWRGTPYQIYQGFVFRSIQIFQFSIWLYATNLNQPSLFCSLYIINYAAFKYAKLLGIVVLPWVWQFTVFSGPFNLFVYISSFSALVCPFLFPFTIDHKLGVCYFWFRASMWYLVLMYWSMVFIYEK